MTSLPGYDNWKTREPPHYEGPVAFTVGPIREACAQCDCELGTGETAVEYRDETFCSESCAETWAEIQYGDPREYNPEEYCREDC